MRSIDIQSDLGSERTKRYKHPPGYLWYDKYQSLHFTTTDQFTFTRDMTSPLETIILLSHLIDLCLDSFRFSQIFFNRTQNEEIIF